MEYHGSENMAALSVREKKERITMLYGEALFHCGVVVLCGAGGLAVAFILIFSLTGRRLHKWLDEEYGEKRH